MSTPGRLRFDAAGRLRGPAVGKLAWNDPWPCVNGRLHVTAGMRGVIMHTMVGDLPGTVAEFNNPAAQVSAHFGIAQDGQIHQFGPVGKGWEAWAQMAGNVDWYSVEHADHGDPANPLTDAQLWASAQVVEALSGFAGFPLQEANTPAERGYGVHYMGGASWGGHTCPDTGPDHPVRSLQRPEILRRAQAIRDRDTASPAPASPGPAAADGYLVTEGAAGGYAGRAVTSADGGKSWQ